MSELSSDAKALIEGSRLDDAPRDDDKQRIRARLVAQLGAGAFASAAVVGSATELAPLASKGGVLAKSLVLKWVAGALAIGGVGALVATQRAPAVPAPVSAPSVEAPAPVIVEPEPAIEPAPVVEPPAVAAVPAVEPAKPARIARKRGATSFAPIGSSGSMGMSAEIALLAQAQKALRARDGKEALRLARQHAENFPNGALYEERVGIEAIAHCLLGERDHPAVRMFLARSPRSPLSARVRKECGVP